MKPWVLFTTCMRALVRNPMRAVLTILGIVIGIAAVVAIREIGEGSKEQISTQVASLGADVVNVWGASVNTTGVNSGKGGRASLYPEDAEAILRECKDTVLMASPMVRAGGQVIVGNKNWSPGSMVGGNEDYPKIEGWTVVNGLSFTKEQVDNSARVCLIGMTIAKELFAGKDPVGQEIRIKDVVFTVIGVLGEKGADMGNDKDDTIIMPWTSIRTRLMGASREAAIMRGGASNASKPSATSTYSTSAVNFYAGTELQPYTGAPHPLRTRTVDNLIIKIKDKENAKPAMEQITQVLRREHNLQPGVLDDFEMFDRGQISSMVTSISDTMTTLLMAVAFISLVVGGVGIMNIMLVSVTERTREIGLRMAVGARPRDIMQQFLLESVLLCLVGGILGIILGHGASSIISAQAGWPIATSYAAMALAVSVAAFIGIVFGWYPAYKASKLDPIDALHHE